MQAHYFFEVLMKEQDDIVDVREIKVPLRELLLMMRDGNVDHVVLDKDAQQHQRRFLNISIDKTTEPRHYITRYGKRVEF